MIRNVSGGNGPWLAARTCADHLVFARGRPDLEPLIVLELADLRDDLGAAVEQADQILVEPIDLASQAPESRLALAIGRLSTKSPIFERTGRLIACWQAYGSSGRLGKKRSEGSRHAHLPRKCHAGRRRSARRASSDR